MTEHDVTTRYTANPFLGRRGHCACTCGAASRPLDPEEARLWRRTHLRENGVEG